MKLMYCPECQDVFKIVIYQQRACRCGSVRGQLLDADLAKINGRGVSMAIGGGSLAQAVTRLHGLSQKQDLEYYVKHCQVKCWVRPHGGPGNPRTKIEQEGDIPPSDAVVLLSQAVKHFRQEHTVLATVPKWVNDAEHILGLIIKR